MALTVPQVCLFLHRFDRMVEALKKRHDGRAALVPVDEYDVQDLIYAALKPLVPDLQAEDPTGKHATTSGRLDLVSYRLGLVIEVKAALKANREKDIPGECRERIEKYSQTRALKTLVFFIYDPQKKISDLDNLQHDIEGHRSYDNGSIEFDVYLVSERAATTFPMQVRAHEPQLAPARPRKNYSREDSLAVLKSWFEALDYTDQVKAIRYAQVDEKLDLSDGTAKQYLAEAISDEWRRKGGGEEFGIFEQKPIRMGGRGGNDPGGWSPSRDGFGGF